MKGVVFARLAIWKCSAHLFFLEEKAQIFFIALNTFKEI